METQTLNTPIVFLDNVGRTIIGKVIKDTDLILAIKNPALVHITTNAQTNQLSLQIFPLFFKEFQVDKSESTIWNYKKINITLSEPINFAPQFIAQYEQLFQMLEQGGAANNQVGQKEPTVVKLFDDAESK